MSSIDETPASTQASKRIPRLRVRSVCFAALLWLPLASGCHLWPFDFSQVWARFEVTLPLAVEAANPFDPDEVEVWAEFQPRRGAVVSAPGFVYRPYQRELLGGVEQLTPTGDLEWRIRFTPDRRGLWRWRCAVKNEVIVSRTKQPCNSTGPAAAAVRFVAVPHCHPPEHHHLLARQSLPAQIPAVPSNQPKAASLSLHSRLCRLTFNALISS